ncbi:MAG: pullulanase-type alpha-1,6-glucosidase, partial [Propionibacteriaceae bacterium]|nr:pullulanase-type alpha-1,6-glucosidase [Propionibacteriaceae bacterium]
MRASITRRFVVAITGVALALSVVGIQTAPAHATPPPGATTDYVIAGSFQSELGCPGDWQAACLETALIRSGSSSIWTTTLPIPAGNWEFKVGVGGSLTGSYGLDGGAANIPLSVAGDADITFIFDATTHQIGYQVDGLREGYEIADGDLTKTPAVDPGAGNQYYFVLTDRFANGESANDKQYYAVNGDESSLTTSDDKYISGYDPADTRFYQGGDIQGIISKLDYIEGLGTTAIWLSPSFVNRPVQGDNPSNSTAGYHGYWITDFTRIDPHLGGNEALADLIEQAHDRGMKVYFDIIANHTADVIAYQGVSGEASYVTTTTVPYTDSSGDVFNPADYASGDLGPFPTLDPATSFPYVPFHPEGAPSLVPSELNDVTLYHNRGNILGDQWQDAGEWTTMGDFSSLDDLMTENPAVVSLMIDIYTSWMDMGIDGFRIDTVKHVNFEFWQQFTAAIKAYQSSGAAGVQPNFFTFGEIYDQDIAGQTSPYMRDTDMNAVLDFPFAFGARTWAKSGDGTGQDLANMFAADDYYITSDSDPNDLVTFLDNHDMGRIGWLLQSAGASDVGARVKLANDLMFLSRGQPVIYYGDEQGILGIGADSLSREGLYANQSTAYQNSPLLDGGTLGTAEHYDTTGAYYEQIQTLSALRVDHPALATGAHVNLGAQWSAYAFARIGDDQVENLIGVNSGTAFAPLTFTTLTPGATYTAYYASGTDGVRSGQTVTADANGLVTLDIPALGAVALEADRIVSDPAIPVTDATFTVTPGIDLGGAGTNTKVSGLAPITANAPKSAWSQTTFSVRVVGSDTWTILGTDTGPNPRVFDNTSKYAAGTLLEYRAVNMDAAGTLVASSTLAGVGVTAEPPADNSASVGWVTIAGALGATGCADWDPACAGLKLEVDPASGLYTTTLSLSAGVYEYKVALNGTWTENYGNYANGVTGMFNGANHQFTLGSATSVFFWYNSETHAFGEVLDGVPHDTIYTVTGTFIESLLMPQDLATCSNWSDVCLRGLMTQDPTVPTRYVWETSAIEAGTDYTAKVVTNMSWSNTSYGPQGTDPGCAPDGWYDSSNCKFTVPAGATVRFVLDTTNNYVSITVLPVVDKGIDALRAYWIDQQTIAWPNALASDATSWTLVTAPEGGITANGSIITTTVGGTSVSQITLTRDPLGLTPSQVDKFRLLASGYTVLKVPAASIGDIPDLLKGETVIAAFAPGKTLRSLTGTQNAGVLDDVYASAARAAIAGGEALGVSWTGDTPTLRLWAPTALDVDLCLYADAEGTGTCVEQTTTLDDATGTWTALGQSDWKDRAYDWNVEVYALEFEYQPNGSVSAAEQLSPTYDSVYNNVVVDPYATGLTVDSTHAVVVKPSDYTPSETQPDTIRSVDQTIYELHVRDFSMADTDADVVIKGTYEAFTDLTSPGMIQLAELQAAGMTTIHLLPTFDIASIPEDRADQLHGDVPADTNGYAARDAVCGPDGITGISAGDGGGTEGCNGYKPNGDKTVASLDGYNWGYDPLHWMAPEGSYAASGTVPDATYSQVGAARNQQFADMVDALHSIGLRVVLDQVYNHTFSSGQTYDNVLDQAVPGYYHRLNQAGAVEKSTCCDEFAGENQMAEQMMIDSVLTWARDYKIDGFRFDLMGFTPYSSMVKLQEALAALADEQGRSGVGDDPAYYLYGEGWDFGSIANNRLFYTAIQGQVNGTGIGTFSDRLRDASLGSHAPLTATGFVTGSPGACNNADVAQGLAGNLYAYTGANVAGCYGHSVGYAENPSETVTYVDAHDNQTLYDMLAMRLPAGTSMADRIRYNTLALATVTFAQTPTFWHGGTDLLRSKSLDPNSYNSGDHFNLIDWTGATNAYGTGLPPTTNRDHADYAGIMSSLLGNASIKPTQADAETAHAMALDLLRLRSSSELFRLGTTDLIKERVTFLPTDNPGVLAMLVSDPSSGSVDIDGLHDAMLVVFNTNTWSVSQGLSGLSGRDFALSDIQSGGADDVVKGTTWTSASGTVSVPALSVAVLFEAASAPEFTPTISGTAKVGELLSATSNVPDGWT